MSVVCIVHNIFNKIYLNTYWVSSIGWLSVCKQILFPAQSENWRVVEWGHIHTEGYVWSATFWKIAGPIDSWILLKTIVSHSRVFTEDKNVTTSKYNIFSFLTVSQHIRSERSTIVFKTEVGDVLDITLHGEKMNI